MRRRRRTQACKRIPDGFLSQSLAIVQHVLHDIPALLNVCVLRAVQKAKIAESRHYMSFVLFGEPHNVERGLAWRYSSGEADSIGSLRAIRRIGFRKEPAQ